MLAAVLGTTTVAMKATRSLITRGSRASRPVRVSSQHIGLVFMKVKNSNINQSLARLTNAHTPFLAAVGPPVTVKPVVPTVTATPIAVNPGTTCPKCGTVKKTGKRSCCAGGGSWYKKCGDEGDSKFDHTWTQGFQACTGKLKACWSGFCGGK